MTGKTRSSEKERLRVTQGACRERESGEQQELKERGKGGVKHQVLTQREIGCEEILVKERESEEKTTGALREGVRGNTRSL